MSEVKYAFDSRLDTDYLESLYEGDKEHASMIFEQFSLAIRGQLQEIEYHFAEGNSEQFRLKVHKVKPTFSFVGLPNLTSQAELIENQCIEYASVGHVAQLYIDFRNNVLELIPVIENELEKLKV